jgi:ABC-type uncharacterized transport system substrate-binding protein
MKVSIKLFVFFLACIFLTHAVVLVAEDGSFSTDPITNNGKKWRLGYYEGGKYWEYQDTLLATIKALMDLGWIEATEIPPQQDEQTQELWNWLATGAKSEYIEFVADAHYSAGWDGEIREKMSNEIIERFNQKGDIDLMIGMGTWAGQDLANDKHHTPIIVLAVSDALASGIVKSFEDSGYDHIHARVDPTRYERQVQIFYDIIGFQKLGVAYKNDVAGRSYAAIDKVEKVASELGFELVSCYVETSPDVQQDEENVKTCFKELTEKVDAIYVTMQKGINARSIPDLVEIANSHGIPTFSQAGSEEVKNGFLLSISLANFKYVGDFHAETIAKVLNGAKPRELDQVFEDPPKIAINLKTAEIIGYDPPVDVLGAADEIYQEIIPPEQ